MIISLRNKKEVFKAGGDTSVTVGQTLGCDLVIPNFSQYEDEIFARITPDINGLGWHLLKLTNFYPIFINGVEMHRVHYLQSGDVISFPGASYRFSTEEGELSSSSVTHLSSNRKLIWGIAGVVLILAVLVIGIIFDRHSESLSPSQRAEIESSLYLLRVDSLHLMHGDTLIKNYTYATPPSGTAFLTTDSLLVTARHCLQPWLNTVAPEDFGTIPSITDWPVNQALFAETQNQLSGSGDWHIVSFISLSHGDDSFKGRENITMNSDQFIIPTETDEIVELGDFSATYYWRSISHRYSREDMMLGDVAYARFPKAGTIPLASGKELRSSLSTGSRLIFAGFPDSSVGLPRVDFKTDELHHPLRDLNTSPGRLFLLTHDGHLSHGFSGGPVLMRFGIGYKAVGVISLTDAKNDSRSYSVPVTEIRVN